MNNNESRFFQWVVGETKGEVKVFDRVETEEADGVNYIVFKDNSRINEDFVAALNQRDLTNKMMAEIDHPNNCWKFKEEWIGREEEKWEMNADGEKVCVVPFTPGKKVIHLVPPKRTAAKTSKFGEISNATPIQTPATAAVNTNIVFEVSSATIPIDKTDPVYILMTKAKKNDADINMGMTISLPPKNLYDIAKESFEGGDEKFIQYIVDEITVEEIKNALKVSIKQMYEGVSL